MSRHTMRDNSTEEWARTLCGVRLFGWHWNPLTLRLEHRYLACTLAVLRVGQQSFNAILLDPTNRVVRDERQANLDDAVKYLTEGATELMFSRLTEDFYTLRGQLMGTREAAAAALSHVDALVEKLAAIGDDDAD